MRPAMPCARVRSNGEIKFGGEMIYVSEALIGETVGISETESGDWLVRFLDLDLGTIDRTSNRLRRFAERPGRAPQSGCRRRRSTPNVQDLRCRNLSAPGLEKAASLRGAGRRATVLVVEVRVRMGFHVE